MATRVNVVQLVQQIVEHPMACIRSISRYVVEHYATDIPYGHIWTSYIADAVGLTGCQVPLTASCDRGANWFRRRKRYKIGQAYGGDYNPQPGDYIYFSATYEQADATKVGIVSECDGIIVKFAMWDSESGSPQFVSTYTSDIAIIGYGIPEYQDEQPVTMPILATRGEGVLISADEVYIHTAPDRNAERLGTLKRGYPVEVVGMLSNGWVQVVWGLSSTGCGFIDNTQCAHKIISDAVPYEAQGYRLGDRITFDGGPLYSRPNHKSKAKQYGPFTGRITGVSGDMVQIEDFRGRKHGWTFESCVDFMAEIGYTKHKGEVVEDDVPVRVGPHANFTKVQKWPQLVRGNIVDVLGCDEDDEGAWYLVNICGIRGYVARHCIKHIEA